MSLSLYCLCSSVLSLSLSYVFLSLFCHLTSALSLTVCFVNGCFFFCHCPSGLPLSLYSVTVPLLCHWPSTLSLVLYFNKRSYPKYRPPFPRISHYIPSAFFPLRKFQSANGKLSSALGNGAIKQKSC